MMVDVHVQPTELPHYWRLELFCVQSWPREDVPGHDDLARAQLHAQRNAMPGYYFHGSVGFSFVLYPVYVEMYA